MTNTLFARTEFEGRLARVRAAMADRNLDLLLVASPANQFWLTGYDGWSFYTPQMVIVPGDGDPVWFGRAMDAAGAERTVFMDHDRIVPYPDTYVASAERHPIDRLVEILTERGWNKGRIGVEMDDYYYTARWHAILTAGLPNADLVDAFLLVNRCRMVKSAQELAYMREAGKIATAAMEASIAAAHVGVRQCDVMAETYRVTTGGTADIGGTFTCKPPNAMVGDMCAAPHLSWTDDPLAAGDLYYIELGGCRHRYHVPLSRCVTVGPPAPRMTEVARVIAEGLSAVLDTVRPGRLCADLAAAWRGVISRHGIEKDSRIGYPVGIGYPPTWGELTCSLRAGDETVLEPGMTFHCIPAIWMERYGLTISESFAVGEAGAETFTDVARVLFSNA